MGFLAIFNLKQGRKKMEKDRYGNMVNTVEQLKESVEKLLSMASAVIETTNNLTEIINHPKKD